MFKKEEILRNLRLELRKGSLVLAVLSQLRDKHYGYSLVETLKSTEEPSPKNSSLIGDSNDYFHNFYTCAFGTR